MRKLIYYVASTIDGFIAGPDGSYDFYGTNGEHSNQLLEEYPETIPVHARQALGVDPANRSIDTVLEGRGAYEVGLREGITNAYPHLRHYVFSRTMTSSPDPTVELVGSDPVAKVRELKQESGLDIWLCGGSELAGVLRPEIDELHVKIYPVVAGAGMSLFGGARFAPQRFQPARSRVYDDGLVFVVYERT
ncbi:dihydrofolate reductase [Phytoactinopolyspora alkaliphila]|uniref:Dihydrofolate reductase n=1 Tax=Phytoactinopolyspora alkaliphila TaxID=1783498 RepID=A0A6N9YTA7_9ACTN|nr:dihydrofolate reductase family protein [Phytoactinopolyspora alkaliphila]NED98266.1 dihydrofolate reductase [Phytoactinopolyspora alkaliphila]